MYKQILVAVDGSETSSRALAAAIGLARDSGARLQPLYVVDVPLMSYDVPGYDPSYVRDALVAEGKHVLADATALMTAAGVIGPSRMVETDLTGDDTAHRILLAAQEFNADVVVMGTHGRRGVQRLVLGSVAEHFLRIATCPVLLISAHCPAPAASPAKTESEPVKDPS
ncbi:universal stress protein [Paraburkholderia sp. RL17-383-BIF-A]|jgi:nucleotide-binding universal stress UspA family protein|uniref:universal stress protein n=1 Tax=Burkholderiaceae TaxID=119060 RepID=UPI00089A4B88|nr:universal stress protein [Burkholderia sp. WP9]SEC11216.1 Nucleotide-binding universal stress protein, UspA family [Burkholderia sp. WP9]